ncbi:hypothetical protein BDV95DRAFT_65983 [Massariosphaeria phaeospora]|uniref:VOC domain-containing protein n=1 Tax=Massariosphaeria phaeospora TaxID=100035 RepID=A0A7C8MJB6_9PLEO|nr:hypothetical protein BDV95DRAFT_65983 [Massariosphaeria phaeospora]
MHGLPAPHIKSTRGLIYSFSILHFPISSLPTLESSLSHIRCPSKVSHTYPLNMLDHVNLFVHPSKFDDVVNWYLAALAPLGYTKQIDYPGQAAGIGLPSDPVSGLWITAKDTGNETGIHIAFRAKDHETVDKFHAEGVKAGGTDNGAPGLRATYGPHYYGGFVMDPVGNNVEAVDHLEH